MDYILSGDAKEVGRILQENRIRVSRGLITFTPVHVGGCEDVKDASVDDTKDVTITDTKAPKRKK